MTTDKPHSIGYVGPPKESTYIEKDGVKYNKSGDTTFVDPTGTPDQLRKLAPGTFKIDKRGDKWVLQDGDPTDPSSWKKE